MPIGNCKLIIERPRSETFAFNLHLEIGDYQFAIAFLRRSEAKPSLKSSERSPNNGQIAAIKIPRDELAKATKAIADKSDLGGL